MSISSDEEDTVNIINSGLSLSTVVRTLRWVSRARVSAWFAEAFNFSIADIEIDSTEGKLPFKPSFMKNQNQKQDEYYEVEDEEDVRKWDLEKRKIPLKASLITERNNCKLTQDNITEWIRLSATGRNQSKEYYSRIFDKHIKDTIQQKEVDTISN